MHPNMGNGKTKAKGDGKMKDKLDQEFWDWWDNLTDYEKEQVIGK